jgi:protein TonB
VAPAAQPDRLEPAKWKTEAFDRSPPYPDAAMKSGVEGQVVLRICIGPTGSVDTATVLKPLGFGCDEAAQSWAKKRWHFEPARRGGKPVPSCIIQPVSFKREQ